MRLLQLLLLFTAFCRLPAIAQPVSFDVILRHGTILDGTGLKAYRGDVGIVRGYIAKIGDLSGLRARLDIDATGLFVAPGFINIHSHAASNALASAENMLTQGVTTEILNADGGGGTDIARQLSQLSAPGLAVNIGAEIGFNSVWAAVMGPSDHRPSGEDVTHMRVLIEQNLQQGAWGVSAGLDYKPGYFAQTGEVTRVVSVAARWRTNFPNHERLTPETGFSSRTGIAETIRIGTEAGLLPVITHMKVQGREQGAAAEIIGLMDKATAAGHYTAADAYPYLAGQTGLGALMVPAWAQDGGREETLKRFRNPELRPRIVKEIEEAMNARFGGPKGVYLPQTQQELVDIMRDLHASAGEAVVQTLEKQNAGAILRFGMEDDLVKILQNPSTAIACDCGASLDTHNHPRFYGTYPRVLGHYVRETKALTWEDAVRKMTGLAANTIGLVDRGFLAPGMIADVTVFDPSTVIDHATYDNPTLPSEGIRYVFVNGQLAVREGKATGERGGRSLLRTGHMPSRVMSIDLERKVSVKGTLEDSGAKVPITLNVSEETGTNRARGSFRLSDPRTKTVIRTEEWGLLQVADGWAALTGRARMMPSGEERSITVIIDQADPLAANHLAGVVVDVEGLYHVTGSLAQATVSIRTSKRP